MWGLARCLYFPSWLENILDEKEPMDADDGYIGEDPKLIKVSKGIQYKQNDNQHVAEALARHCHEAGNCLFTKFGTLSKQFMNDLTDHSTVLQACVVLIQLSIEFGSMHLFDVAEVYDDLNKTTPSEADLEDVVNDLDDDYEDGGEEDVSL